MPQPLQMFLLRVLASLLLASTLLPTLAAAPAQPRVEWLNDVVHVSNLPRETLHHLSTPNADFRKILSVYAAANPAPDMPPMLGRYTLDKDTLQFYPRFPLEPGITYTALFTPGPNLAPLKAQTSLTRKESPTTTLTEIYPTAPTLPENLLKFYIHFSAPMRGGDIYRHITLRDESGKAIDLPFLELGEELWNPAMTRLTLFIDPGRIKRGVAPLEDLGPALEAGKRYTLTIDSAWQDAAGQPLKKTVVKSFAVSDPIRSPIDPAHWQITSPPANSREPLTVRFDRAMDHALAERMIRLLDASGKPVEGSITLIDHESRWQFTPAAPWRAGDYKIVAQTILEDLSGNNIGKAFEVDVFEKVDRHLTSETIELPVRIR